MSTRAVDVFERCRGACSGCADGGCVQYERRALEQPQGYNPAATVNFNDVSVLLCAGCGCDSTKHEDLGLWKNM